MCRGCTCDLVSVPRHCLPFLLGQAALKHQAAQLLRGAEGRAWVLLGLTEESKGLTPT